jgi:hypothetical protein
MGLQQVQQWGQQANAVASYLMQPPKQRGGNNGPKIDDGDHVVVLTKVEMKDRQSGGQMIVVGYSVVESTVPRCQGVEYENVMLWDRPFQVEDLADFMKLMWGPEAAQQLAQQNPSAQQLAEYVVNGFQSLTQQGTALYAHLNVRRSQKKLNEGVPYNEVFPNHNWRVIVGQPFTLADVNIHVNQGAPHAAGGMPQNPLASQPQPQQPAPPPAPAPAPAPPPPQQYQQAPAQQPAPVAPPPVTQVPPAQQAQFPPVQQAPPPPPPVPGYG